MKYGINYDSGVNRFAGNEALFTKFLKKFVDDPTFSDLRKAMAGTDTDEAFRQAHTLKGVVGNLSFDDLFEKLNPVWRPYGPATWTPPKHFSRRSRLSTSGRSRASNKLDSEKNKQQGTSW